MVRKIVWPMVLFTSILVCAFVVVLNSNGWVPVLWEGTVLIDGAPQYPALAYVVFEPAVRPESAAQVVSNGAMSDTNDAVAAQGER